ncbi:MAG: HDIG domain-containing protein [Bacteroidetes bacterium]|nr:HDIG domain-containing protein [Bacteroidota bacterium]PHX82923.1 MAG: transmembrane HD family protein [Flavobacteriales bacterium]
MNKLFTFIRDRHALLYKGFIFVASLSVIVYCCPRESKFRYDLSDIKDRPWSYDNLVAPFDYAIQKSTEELQDEKKDIQSNSIPYFRFDTTISNQNEQILSTQFVSIAPEFRREILIAVDKVYALGIRAVSNEVGKSSQDLVNVVFKNVVEEHHLSDFQDPLAADSLVLTKLELEAKAAWINRPYEPLSANIIFDSSLTNKSIRQAIDNISSSRGAITKGQIIVSRGEMVNEEIYQKIFSLNEEYRLQRLGGRDWLITLAQILLVGFCLFILFQFLRLFRREILAHDSRLLFILLIVVLTVCMSYIPASIENISLLALPFCILPVIIRAFFDTRLALFTHLLVIIMISINMPGDRFAFLVIQVLTGITTIFSIANLRNRSQLFVSVIAILFAYFLLHVLLILITSGDFISIRGTDFVFYAISALLVLLAFPLIFLFEKIFGFVSDVTLMELADTNNPLLRELAEKAPGTFQHSMQVANLAEEAIRKIGGNSLLTRAGALYHDIGKAEMPIYFIENQAGGINPHDEMSFEESASIIISHVLTGIQKAKAAKLPDQVIDFIRTHHGTTNTTYFLALYKKNNPDIIVDEELFRYPGPIPYSKETAVLMMADAVEAASRALRQYDADSIDSLVENIIDIQADQHQFDNADITLKDISGIKKLFKKKLRSIYHVRVEYPK